MKNVLRLFVLAGLLAGALNGNAQTSVDKVVIVNGGQFGNPLENANLALYDPVLETYEVIDTMQVGSVQNIIIEDSMAYIAGQDSVFAYDLYTKQRVAAARFKTPGAESVIGIAVSDNYLLAGNWYGPFGGTLTGHNLRVFNKSDLSFVDSIAIPDPVADIAVFGDTAYIRRNYTSSSFSDSAGYFTKVDLTNLTIAGDWNFSNNGEDLGRLVTDGTGRIFGLNSSSNTVTIVDVNAHTDTTFPVPANIRMGSYGSQAQYHDDQLIFRFGSGYGFGMVGFDSVGVYDLTSHTMVDTVAIDSNILAFSYDFLNDRVYQTQSDFVSFTTGSIFEAGSYQKPLPVGFSPEVIGIWYRNGNAAPYAFDDIDTVNALSLVIDVQANDLDVDGDDLTTTVLTSTIAFGNASVLNGDSIEFTAFIGVLGTQVLDYEICDNGTPSLCDTAQLTLYVNNPQSIAENTFSQIQVYPNPAADYLAIGGVEVAGATARIFDVTGKEHWSGQLNASGQVQVLPIADWQSGVYLLQLRSGDQVGNYRFIKQ